jgi:L-lactate dehydrogenase (cytochrome)
MILIGSGALLWHAAQQGVGFDHMFERGRDLSLIHRIRGVDAVGKQIEIHMDGGVRSGQDILKARALGAQGCYIGRAFLYGLGAMGETGVKKVLEILHKELDLTMAFCGRTDIETVDKSILLPGTYPT